MSAAPDPPEWVVVLCLIAVTVQLIRLAIDLIQSASIAQTVSDHDKLERKEVHAAAEAAAPAISGIAAAAPLTLLSSASKAPPSEASGAPNYGSIEHGEGEPFLPQIPSIPSATAHSFSQSQRNALFFTSWSALSLLFLVAWIVHWPTIFPAALLLSASAILLFELYMLACDWKRQRYGIVQRFFHLCAGLILWSVFAVLWMNRSTTSVADSVLFAAATCNVVLSVAEGWVTGKFIAPFVKTSATKKKELSWSAIYKLVKPYVWPDATDSSAMANRVRAIATWFCVIASKVCGLVSPLYLGWASTALAHQDYAGCIRYSVLYSFISWLGTTFREGQSLIYLKVAQAAFVQLSETAFGHLHSLSLDWHLRKKLGEVLRSMDRGIAACDTLMKYICLWLIPAIVECIVVCIIFATYFKYLPLGVTVFYFVFVYIVWTILVTVWRKKFRKALVQSDNAWHDHFTDSLINFETVKFFTAEQYEMDRFSKAVSNFQAGSVHVQASLSFLNISQQILLKLCLALALSLAAFGIKKRIDCCVNLVGCDSGISDCCQSISQNVCPGSTCSKNRLRRQSFFLLRSPEVLRFRRSYLMQCKSETLLRYCRIR